MIGEEGLGIVFYSTQPIKLKPESLGLVILAGTEGPHGLLSAGDGVLALGMMNLTLEDYIWFFLRQPSVSEEPQAWSIKEMRGDRTESQ